MGAEFAYSRECDKLVAQVAKQTGVDEASVKTVLKSLGIDGAMEQVAQGGGAEKLSLLSPDNVAVCIRHENTVFAKSTSK